MSDRTYSISQQTPQDEIAEVKLRILTHLYDAGTLPVMTDYAFLRFGARNRTPEEIDGYLRELTGQYIDAANRAEGDRVYVLTDSGRNRLDKIVRTEGQAPAQPVSLIVLIRRVLSESDNSRFRMGECTNLWNQVDQGE